MPDSGARSDVRATHINDEMKKAAVLAIADLMAVLYAEGGNCR